MSLYLKYRPKTLDEIFGNETTKEELTNILSNKENCTHAFLLYGEKGCGKTTIGRIIAKELECSKSDFHELDSADFRGIDTIREIRKRSQLMAMQGDVIVWLLDECHQISKDGQHALLKLLEDTPKHVYLILCTTDPQKLLPTVRDRCVQLEVKPLLEKQMMRLLHKIVRSENEQLGKEIYEQIIQDSLCHPRAALQILDQVLRVSPDLRLKVAEKQAERQNQSIELCRALLQNTGWKKVQNILNGLKNEEPETIRRMVLGYCQAVLLKNDNEQAGLIMEEFIEPFFNTGFAGLVYACYSVIKN
jgi:DNA polymerase III gamma/tau subunit